MPEGRNTNKRPRILIGVALCVAVVAGIAFVYQATSTTPPQPRVQVADATVEAEAVIADDRVAEDEDTPSSYTRLDDGNLVLVKQKTPDATLEEVTSLFDEGAPIILAKCYSVNGCLKARQIMEPLAHDDVVQEAFYTVIIEAFDVNAGQPVAVTNPPDPDRIVYMFALPKCGMDMGAPEYTSTGLLEAAMRWYQVLAKSCLGK